MKLYHLDRSSTIRPNQNISLKPLSSLSADMTSSPFLSCFSQGISYHGLNQLRDSCPYIEGKPSATGELLLSPQSFSARKSLVDEQIIEVVFELVRRAHFPDLPSRFTSLFAVNSLNEFSLWPELTNAERFPYQQVIEIDVPDGIPCFDASFLQGGLIFDQQKGQYYMGFLPVAAVDFAFRYWSGHRSDHPRIEYLIPLPISEGQYRMVH